MDQAVGHVVRAVVFPKYILYSKEQGALSAGCTRALGVVYDICADAHQGHLTDEDLNTFQHRVFDSRLTAEELVAVKRAILEKCPTGLISVGQNQFVTLDGFLALHEIFIAKERQETTWAVLSKFGFDRNLELTASLIKSKQVEAGLKPFDAPTATTVWQLTKEGVEFLRGYLFRASRRHAPENPEYITPAELDALLAKLPEKVNPWGASVQASLQTRPGGSLDVPRSAWLAMWNRFAYEQPDQCMVALGYLGMDVTAVRPIEQLDARRDLRTRSVFRVKVVGAKGCGKSSLIRSVIGKTYVEDLHIGEPATATLASTTGKPSRDMAIVFAEENRTGPAAVAAEGPFTDIYILLYAADSAASFEELKATYQALPRDAVTIAFCAKSDLFHFGPLPGVEADDVLAVPANFCKSKDLVFDSLSVAAGLGPDFAQNIATCVVNPGSINKSLLTAKANDQAAPKDGSLLLAIIGAAAAGLAAFGLYKFATAKSKAPASSSSSSSNNNNKA
jgi:Ras family protein T1